MLGHYAGFATRLLAFVIDLFIVSTTIVFVSWFTSTTIDMLQSQVIINSVIRAVPAIEGFTNIIASPVTHSLVSLVFIIAYYLFFWTMIGQTPGKYIMGVRVVTVDGGRLRISRSALRYLGYYLSGLCLGMGFIWILFDDERRGWHDRLAGTCVIYVWDARPDEKFLTSITGRLIRRGKLLQTLLRRNHLPTPKK
jgi:uncharacterized RDD family membrane protein YckC